jgi:phage gp46-like protein
VDVAFTRNAQGKLVFAKDAQGGFYLDDRAVFAVFATLFARKGEYAYDATVGTYLHKVRRDGRLTGSRLNAAASDALDQARKDRVISSGTSTAQRISTGAWELRLEWNVPGRGAVTAAQRL